MIPKEVKELVKKLVDSNIKEAMTSLIEELNSAKAEIEQLKVELQILKEGENI